MLSIINKLGYIILKNKIIISNNDLKNIENQIENSKTFIFNHDWDNNDNKRIQQNLIEDNITFMPQLNEIIKNINPELKQSKWVIIKSEPGCHKQMAHLDYIPTPEFNKVINGDNKNKIPLLVLTSLMKETYIHIWDHSIELMNGDYNAEPIKSNKLLLDEGDILIFRSDVIHAGSEYDKTNIRLHCYLDSPDINREEDTTFIVSLDSKELAKLVIE